MESSCDAISRSPSGRRWSSPARPPTPRRRRRTASSRRGARSRAFTTASRSGRGCWRSSPTRRARGGAPPGGGREWTRRAAAAEGAEARRGGGGGADPLALAIAGEVRGELLGALAALGARDREVLSLRYLLDMSEGRDGARARLPARDREVAPVTRARAPARGGGVMSAALEGRLRELATDVDWPPTPDLAPASVLQRIESGAPAPRRSPLALGRGQPGACRRDRRAARRGCARRAGALGRPRRARDRRPRPRHPRARPARHEPAGARPRNADDARAGASPGLVRIRLPRALGAPARGALRRCDRRRRGDARLPGRGAAGVRGRGRSR